MRALDTFEQVAFDGEFPVCILGNLQTRDFEMVAVGDGLRMDSVRTEIATRGLDHFIGTISFIDNAPRMAFAVPLDPGVAAKIAFAYFQHVAVVGAQVLEVADLQRLHALPDNRQV